MISTKQKVGMNSAGTIQSGTGVSNPNGFSIWAPLLVAVATLASRVPLRSHQLFDWDAVQFALGLKHFDIRVHQPHPPGYPVFIVLGRAAYALFGDANTALVSLSIAFTLGSLLLIYWLSRRMFNSDTTAFIASAVWATSPLVWFYGEVASIYTASAFASLLIAATSWNLFSRPDLIAAVLSGLSFAIASGLRPDQVILMLPIWVFPFIMERRTRRYFVPSAAILASGYLSWYVPLVRTVGGAGEYSRILRQQFLSNARMTSIFLGAGWKEAVLLPVKFGYAMALAVGVLGLGILAATALSPRHTDRGRKLPRSIAWFLFVWAGPSVLFFTTIHIGQLGYVMSCAPPFFLWGAHYLYQSTKGNPGRMWGISAGTIALGVIFFLGFPSPIRGKQSGKMQYIPVEHEISFREDVAQQYYDQIAAHPGTVVFVAASGTPYLDWRRLKYHFPERHIIGIREWKSPGQVTADTTFGGDLQLSPGTADTLQLQIPEDRKPYLVILPREEGTVGISEGSAHCTDVLLSKKRELNVFELLECDPEGGELGLTLGGNHVTVR